MTTYEAWQREDNPRCAETSFGTAFTMAKQKKQGLMPGKWKRIHRFNAKNWDDAMTKYYKLMGYGEYKPMK